MGTQGTYKEAKGAQKTFINVLLASRDLNQQPLELQQGALPHRAIPAAVCKATQKSPKETPRQQAICT